MLHCLINLFVFIQNLLSGRRQREIKIETEEREGNKKKGRKETLGLSEDLSFRGCRGGWEAVPPWNSQISSSPERVSVRGSTCRRSRHATEVKQHQRTRLIAV